MQLLTYLLTVS